MSITRDVIYDLLPAYFADEASADTRALVDQFMSTDPEFKKMADRFRALLERRDATAPYTERELERLRFDSVRRRASFRLIAAIWAAVAVAAFVVTALTGLGPFGYLHPGLLLGVFFGVCASGAWLASLAGGWRSLIAR